MPDCEYAGEQYNYLVLCTGSLAFSSNGRCVLLWNDQGAGGIVAGRSRRREVNWMVSRVCSRQRRGITRFLALHRSAHTSCTRLLYYAGQTREKFIKCIGENNAASPFLAMSPCAVQALPFLHHPMLSLTRAEDFVTSVVSSRITPALSSYHPFRSPRSSEVDQFHFLLSFPSHRRPARQEP